MENYLHPDSFKGMHQLMWVLKLLRIHVHVGATVGRFDASNLLDIHPPLLLLLPLLLLIGMT
jgi:hypothetical protein